MSLDKRYCTAGIIPEGQEDMQTPNNSSKKNRDQRTTLPSTVSAINVPTPTTPLARKTLSADHDLLMVQAKIRSTYELAGSPTKRPFTAHVHAQSSTFVVAADREATTRVVNSSDTKTDTIGNDMQGQQHDTNFLDHNNKKNNELRRFKSNRNGDIPIDTDLAMREEKARNRTRHKRCQQHGPFGHNANYSEGA